MTAALAVRPATPDDEPLFRTFRCSRGVPYEDEVERFVNTALAEWSFAPLAQVDDPRTLLVVEDGPAERIVAIAAHERLTALADDDGTPLDGTKVEVVAVAAADRGTRVDGQRLGDLAFAAVLDDAATRPYPRGPWVAGVVSDDNKASLALCDRWNLSVQLPAGDGYTWRIGSLG
ncbi:MAG TPA: hypothetical protein VFQ85_11790 [Mycobacteriales bacterium]|nr:hypothetical protein [Mycobacteriales bacterium]